MPEIHRTRVVAPPGESGVVVVHCSDMRYQPHFQDFLRNGLRLESYGALIVPGGIQCLDSDIFLPKFSWAGRRWLKFMIRLMKPERLVLITHEDCRWYANVFPGERPSALRRRQIEDLHSARVLISRRFAVPRVETYLARLECDQAVFETVA